LFEKNKQPVFPDFDNNAMSRAVFFIDNFSLWETLPATENDLKHFIRDIDNSVYLRNFYSPSKKCAAVMLYVRKDYKSASNVLERVRELSDIARAETEGKYNIDTIGYLVLSEEMKTTIAEDTKFFIKLAALFIIISFYLSFGTLRGVLLPFLTLSISEIWLLGIMGELGHDLNIVLYIVPIFVVAVGSSASIHILSHFYQALERGRDNVAASMESVKDLMVPICTAAATTALGFAALTISGVYGLNIFVIMCVTGLGITTFLSLLFIPAMNILLPAPTLTAHDETSKNRKWTKLIHFIVKRRTTLIVIFVFLTFASIFGIKTIETDNDLTLLLDQNSKTLKLSNLLSKELAGSTIFTLAIEGMPGWPIRKEYLDKISTLQEELEKSPNIDKTTSIADIFKITNYLSNAGDERVKSVAEEQYQIYSHLHFLHSIGKEEAYKDAAAALESLMNTFLNKDCSAAKIMVRSNLTSLRKTDEEMKRIHRLCREILGEHVEPRVFGGILKMNEAVGTILYGQTQGVILALVIIFIIMLIIFFSLKIAFLCLLPNIFPIAFFYGILGLAGIGLDLSSGLVACIAIGIAVDDTIHFMIEFKKQLKRTYVTEDAMLETLKSVGPPIMHTSFVLAVLFGVLYFSRFPVMSNLGILQSFTMLVCLVCNLFLLPAVLASVRLVSIWDILLKFYAFDPSKVPVFEGLSKWTIRLLLSLGKIIEFKTDETMISCGDMGNEMYIIVEGDAEVILKKEKCRAMTVALGTGAIIGEMSVLGKVKRTADVIARTPVKVVSISEEFFVTASRLYPRLVNKFLMNIIGVITKRMIDTEHLLLSQKCGAEKEV
jgi:predicted RND superfamily exporter protein